ncbi:OmpA family protein [Spirosoma aureum]|uniref:OmpA family protein n=1 Tax=Spirosoma aureum TaxID=2692134 RepID=A0A6G9ALA0_9BACT|nr:OmpA family protein [Spirosoma aureum]QIP13106.1 OmpA family protein [Spirosoma aureum]
MKLIGLFLAGLLLVFTAQAQESGDGVSVSRSVRQKISTKSLYVPEPTASSKKPKGTNPSEEKAANPLQAIQFVQSQAEFLPSSQPALEELVAFMRSKPTVEIELAGHTDNQGDFDQNVLLSKKRVDLVKDYLVKNGIASSRITTRGYGPTRPIASNSTETTRKLNRRVEMYVLKQ